LLGGALAELIHYAKGIWVKTLADPLNEPPFKSIEVIKVDARQKDVRLLYVFESRRLNDHYYLYSFRVVPGSGRRNEIAKQQIELPQYLELKRRWRLNF
jgi:hypothetical protein